MGLLRTHNYSGRTPPPARPAFLAALIELVLGLAVFGVFVAMASVAEGVSPWTAIVGPLPGTPLIIWLYFLAPVVALQGVVGLALRHPARLIRAVGVLAAFGIAGVALVWVAAALYDLVAALVTEMDRYIAEGGLATLPFVPVALLIAALNARAGRLGLRGVRRQRSVPALP
ncbi:MAG: hypothetical protein ACTHNK_00425 [Thermomicrobiales bacterium]